jgi:hypothetical protein
VNPILQSYTEALKAVKYSSTRFPVLSNVTGDWHGSQCTSAEYWAQHLRQPVRFYDNLKRLARRFPTAVVVEVGPSVLAGVVAREATRIGVDWQVVPTMRERDEVTAYMNCLGMLWAHADLKPDLPVATPKKELLPTYPFQRQVLAAKKSAATAIADRKQARNKATIQKKLEGDEVANFFYECCHERVDVSCRRFEEAAIVLDGEILPKGLPKHAVQATPDRAVVAARSTGCLIFVGTSSQLPTTDDTSQETLIKTVMSLLGSLAKSKTRLEIFFCLKANVRYSALWGLLRSAACELSELRLRRLLIEDDQPLMFPALPGETCSSGRGAHVARVAAPRRRRSSYAYGGGVPGWGK